MINFLQLYSLQVLSRYKDLNPNFFTDFRNFIMAIKAEDFFELVRAVSEEICEPLLLNECFEIDDSPRGVERILRADEAERGKDFYFLRFLEHINNGESK
jgi:hypothetical protein